MTANLSNPTPARIARWLSAEVATALRCGSYAELYVSVPRAGGKIDEATYYVEGVLCQVSGQVTAWKMTRKNLDGSWGECYTVAFSANGNSCQKDSGECPARRYGHGADCKHISALRNALNRAGIAA